MSHVVSIKCEIKDLAALEDALKEFKGAKLVRDVKTYRWFGQWMNDYGANDAAYKQGIDPKDYGKCEHRIELSGCGYDIGLVKKGDGFVPVCDFWGTGQVLQQTFGNNLSGLIQQYGVAKAVRLLKQKGAYGIQKTVQKDGTIKINATLA
jgi:hypothetical protein